MKRCWKPGTMIYPLPAVLVSCGDYENANLITIAWTGILCTNPAMCYISVRPERHSYPMIVERMEFTINLTTEEMARAVDWCGVNSASKYPDKWAETGLTKERGVMVGCPSIAESPLAIECRVKEIVHLGSHDMMIADVLDVLADESLFDPATDRFDLERAHLLAYSHGHYYGLGNDLGHFGWSVRKTPRREK